MKKDHVWYFGYGSNLSEQRFLCYILGGKPNFGNIKNSECTNNAPPSDNKPYKIPYKLYFGIPGENKKTKMWGLGGVAFISPIKTENSETLGRIWRISEYQCDEIKKQEGISWYNKTIDLGNYKNISILTITSCKEIKNILPPSIGYLKTIILGLQETHQIPALEIANYLIQCSGITGNFTKEKIIKIVNDLYMQ